MTKLSVNINKVATLRNARGGAMPDLLQVAKDCESFGAEGITVHPRPDERHIRYEDVWALKPLVTTELNIEGYPSPTFIDLVLQVKPEQVTLVPDPPDALTSNAGWEVQRHYEALCGWVRQFQDAGIRTSLFVDASIEQVEWAAKTGARRVELYTEPYASAYPVEGADAARPFVEAADVASRLGMEVNAGHDLNLKNLASLAQQIPSLAEVSIGHALICDALYFGLEETIRRYRACLKSE